MSIDGDLDQYVSQGVGVLAHTIELFIRDACGLVSEEFATPCERTGLTHVVLTWLGARQLLHSHRATNSPGHSIRSTVPDTARLAASGTLPRLSLGTAGPCAPRIIHSSIHSALVRIAPVR
jgi:hypothetical protein